jgi:hypothetical protein
VETDLVQFSTNWAGCFGTPPFSFLALLYKDTERADERAKCDDATEDVVDSGISFNAFESDFNFGVGFGKFTVHFVI